jgi:hypothetical protein
MAALNLHHLFVPAELMCVFSSFFDRVRFASAQPPSSPSFPFLGATSPPADIITSLHRVTLPSQYAKTSSLPLVHIPAMLCPITSPLEPKLKH